MEIWIIVILSILLIVSIYINVNLYRKVIILERYCGNFLSDLTNLKDKILAAFLVMKETDIRGSFEADDEVGSAFKIIKTCLETLANESGANVGNSNDNKKDETQK